MTETDERAITRDEAAEILGVDTRTIRRWQERGLLARVPIGPRTSRVLLSEIRALLGRRGTLPAPGTISGIGAPSMLTRSRGPGL